MLVLHALKLHEPNTWLLDKIDGQSILHAKNLKLITINQFM